ncbi:hypothetical protein RHMOL_Rhmol08G0077100 [Rhododendron molle]|uniref:Uncharacterized protein n=1 Tax=Rhododendron molle TaxID=49168 RepID=A0ACC0ML73_RHOML|nr:hypothetical protein RHMOL_Rhmol08G0077100 [Rhododendron molle]
MRLMTLRKSLSRRTMLISRMMPLSPWLSEFEFGVFCFFWLCSCGSSFAASFGQGVR